MNDAALAADTIAKRLDTLSLGEVQARHAELIAKGKGSAQNLGDTDLEELVQIFAVLRRRSSGPPTAKKTKSSGPEKPLDELL